jgi:type IV pilus assembly protein PilX
MHQPSLNRPDNRRRRLAGSRRPAQRGATLLFALLTLVALLLAGLALVRSIDTGAVLLGNIGFKQDATVTADQATGPALAWLTSNYASLSTDAPSNGYYASSEDVSASSTTPLDVTGQQMASTATRQLIDWDGNSCAAAPAGSYSACVLTPTTYSGGSSPDTVKYVIFRLCSASGDYTSSSYTGTCATPVNSSGPSSPKKGELNYSDSERFTGDSSPYYRVVVRVLGARNTTSFTESIVHF